MSQFDASKLVQQNVCEQEETEIENLYGRIQAYSRSIQPEDDPVSFYFLGLTSFERYYFPRDITNGPNFGGS